MNVRRLQWIGVRTDDRDGMARLFRDVLGMQPTVDDAATIKFTLANGDEFQVFAEGHADYDFLVEHQVTAPVPMFEVDDVKDAYRELQRSGVSIVGDGIYADDAWEWVHFRAPDGNLYEVASRRPDSEPTPS